MPSSGPSEESPQQNNRGSNQRLAEVVPFPAQEFGETILHPSPGSPAPPEGAPVGTLPVARFAIAALADAVLAGTHATGVAVAMTNPEGIILCVANSGHAPAVGSVLNPTHGITGACVQTRHVQVCFDTLDDPRVDVEVCRAAGIRSAVVVPVLQDNLIRGVVSAYSDRRNHFDDAAVQALSRLAEILASPAPAAGDIASPREASPLAPASPVQSPPAAAAETLVPFDFSLANSEAWEQADASRRRLLLWLAAGLAALLIAFGGPLLRSFFHAPGVRVISPAEPQYSEPTPTAPPATPQTQDTAQIATIYPISYHSGPRAAVITVPLSRYVSFRSGTLHNPERLFLDLVGTRLAISEKAFKVDVGDEVVRSVRIAQNEDNLSRVVVDLNSKVEFKAAYAADPPRVELTVTPAAKP